MVPLLTVILWAFGGKLSPHAGNCFPSSCPSSWDVSAPCPLGPPVPGNSKPDDPASTTNYCTSCSQQALVLGQWVSLWLHGWVPNNAGTGSHLRHEIFWGPGRTLRGSYIHKDSVIPRTACSAQPPALLGHISGLSIELPSWRGTSILYTAWKHLLKMFLLWSSETVTVSETLALISTLCRHEPSANHSVWHLWEHVAGGNPSLKETPFPFSPRIALPKVWVF